MLDEEKKKNYVYGAILSIIFILCMINIRNINASEANQRNPLSAQNNNDITNSTLIEEGWYRDLVFEDNEIHWYKIEIYHNADLEISVHYSAGDGNITIELYEDETTQITNSSMENSNYQKINASVKYDEDIQDQYVYLKIFGNNVDIGYHLYFDYITTGDSSGFYISEDYLNQGYRPNTLLLLLNYIFMGAVILLYLQFGLSFIFKAKKNVASSEAQSRYYRGLGVFIITVALSESSYLLDLFSRDVLETRVFNTYNSEDSFYSFFEADYFIVSVFLVLIGLTVLMYPMESYLYARKKKLFTLSIGLCIPLPIIIRQLEINHSSLGLDLSSTSTMHYQLFTAIWLFMVLIGGIGLLYLIKLYLDLGSKAPRGSKLRKKSRQIIMGLFIWIGAIFSTSSLLKEISDVTSDWGPYSKAIEGFAGWFSTNSMYYILPFILPTLLFIALRLLIVGFTRDY